MYYALFVDDHGKKRRSSCTCDVSPSKKQKLNPMNSSTDLAISETKNNDINETEQTMLSASNQCTNCFCNFGSTVQSPELCGADKYQIITGTDESVSSIPQSSATIRNRGKNWTVSVHWIRHIHYQGTMHHVSYFSLI